MTRTSLTSVSLALFLSFTLVAQTARAGQVTPTPSAAPVGAPQGRGTAPPPPTPPPPIGEPQTPGKSSLDGNVAPQGNVRIDISISDTLGAAPTTKTVTMLIADRHTSQIRSSQSVAVPAANGGFSYQSIGINVDATPEIRPDGRVFARLTLSYTPQVPVADSTGQKPVPSIDESMSVLLLDGKKTMLTQSADPQSDRKVTLEVTATVVR